MTSKTVKTRSETINGALVAAAITRDPEFDEYMVTWKVSGETRSSWTYFTDTRQDAVGTMNAEFARMIHRGRVPATA